MTYCVAMRLADGLVFASDSRTNAGVDHISTFRKMHVFDARDNRVLVILTAGNLATSQSVITLLRSRTRGGVDDHLLNVPTLYDAAELVGETLREVLHRDAQGQQQCQGVDFGCTMLLGGQIAGEEPRLFMLYPQGNFIEATSDTPYFQIGESKYGKPVIDRVVDYDTSLELAYQSALISFDSTMKSNLSVGMPLDLMVYRNDSLDASQRHRIDESDAHFTTVRELWNQGIRDLIHRLPLPQLP